jgi:hypothetical protein
VQVSDIESMRDKFRQLGEALDESQYDWRPMDAVRSVREVLGVAVVEANLSLEVRCRSMRVSRRPWRTCTNSWVSSSRMREETT